MDKTDLPGDRVKKIRVKRPYVKSRKAYQREYRARRAAEKRRERDIITSSKEELLAILGALSEKVDTLLREQAVIKLNMASPILRAPYHPAVSPLATSLANKPLPTSSVIPPEEMERCRFAAIEAAQEEAAEREAEIAAMQRSTVAAMPPKYGNHQAIYQNGQNGHLREEPPTPRLIP